MPRKQFHQVLGEQYLFDDVRNTLYFPVDINTILLQKPEACDQFYTLIATMPFSNEIDVQVTFRPLTVAYRETFLDVLMSRGFELLGLEKFGEGFYDPAIELPQKSSFDSAKDGKTAFEEFMKCRFVFTPLRTQFYHPVDEVRWDLNPSSTFHQNGIEMSFEDYYRLHYGIEIEDLTQPLLLTKCSESGKGNHIYRCLDPMIVDGKEKFMVNIPELCHVSGLIMECRQLRTKQLAGRIRGQLVISPQKLITTITNYLDLIHSSKDVTKLFSDWGIELDPSFVQVEWSVLPGPRIKFNSSTHLNFDCPDTFLSVHSEFPRLAGTIPVYTSPPLLHWILVCTATDEELAVQFCDAFANEMETLGLKYPGVRPALEALLVRSPDNKELANKFVDIIRNVKTDPQLVAFIIPTGNNGSVYKAVKKFTSIELGIPSQGIRAKSLRSDREFARIVQGISLQICSKLGGAPWALDTGEPKEMIMTVGIDTFHDRAKKIRSVMAIVCTLNPECTKYYSRTVMQEAGVEAGSTLATIFFAAYVEFYRECGTWPTKVIVLRDGVSNSHLDLIRAHEVLQIRRSMERFPVPPKLIFVVVQKYTTDRLMLLQEEKVLNLLPGTVVDNTITRTDYKDFFLISQIHRGRGFAKPIRCVVLEDDADDFDYVKTATYAASFTYFNQPGSLRIPAVCQYAHKAAGFVGRVLKEIPPPSMESLLFYL